jgi:hypothetical protein
MRTAEIEIRDIDGGRVFQGWQIDHGPEWHISGVSYNGIMLATNQGDLAKLISREIFHRDRWSLHTHWTIQGEQRSRYAAHDCYPDEMGGVVIDGEYLGYAEWLRRVIPRTVLKTVDETPRV